MGTLLRRAAQEDLADIVQLWIEISRAEFAAYIGPETVEQFISSGELAAESRRILPQTTICTDDGQLAGIVVVIDDLIELLLVRQSFQNRFVGKRLYDHARSEVCGNGFRQLRAECFRSNSRITSILQRLGFRTDGSYRDDMGFTTLKMSIAC